MRNNIRPILFSGEMVNAILEGRKTQTRRIVKLDSEGMFRVNKIWRVRTNYREIDRVCPYGIVGDRLWVRETWQETTFLHPSDDNYGYIYRASDNGRAWEDSDENWKWKPSIFMPRRASRIRLEITNIRVERLQDISEEDAKAEGVRQYDTGDYKNYEYDDKFGDDWGVLSARSSFISLWDKINGKNAPVESNPWVWVIEFRRIDGKQD